MTAPFTNELLTEIARGAGTPVYAYSSDFLKKRVEEWTTAFRGHPTLSCFAVKANAHPKVLKTLGSLGLGADVVSVGEMELALAAGIPAERIVFSGVGKTKKEIRRALEAGIHCLNVESAEELAEVADIGRQLGKKAPIALRINPDIDPKTHPYIATGLACTKFGIDVATAKSLAKEFGGHPSLHWKGLACHIGSQIQDLEPFRESARQLVALAKELKAFGVTLTTLDLGGGLGIRYEGEIPPTIQSYADVILKEVAPSGLSLILEPGRILVAESGVLLTEVVRVKKTAAKNFVIVDAAMNDLMRPALYEAYHRIVPLKEISGKMTADVVGPICETADTLGFDRTLGEVRTGDLLMIQNAGAYGATMSSTYNARPLARQVWVEGNRWEKT